MLDEIYDFVGAKAHRRYVFTAYGITDAGFVARYARAFEQCSIRSLIHFLRDLPLARMYFSDGAPMYGHVLTTKVLQEKGVTTNLVESFNAQVRQFTSTLRRCTKAYAKDFKGFVERLALTQIVHNWLVPERSWRRQPAPSLPT